MAKASTTATGFDQFTEALEKTFDWAAKNGLAILVIAVVLAVAGGGLAIASSLRQSNEETLQEKYFVVEKKVMDLKRGFEEAAQQEKVRAANAKAGKTADPKEAVGAKATGDLAKDYGTLPSELEAVITEAPSSNAAKMAALTAGDLYIGHGRADQALELLNKVNGSDETSHLLGALTVNMKADIAAEKGDCKTAVGLWEKITRDAHAKFLHDDSKVRMGLCFEAMNDLARAETMYVEVSSKDAKNPGGESAVAKDAERYLRLLRLKKATRGS